MKVAVADISGKRATFKQTAIRGILKFLPWEFFHTIYWHWEGWPTNPAPPTSFQIVALTFGWIMIGLYIIGLFVGSRRTLYDLAAGTIVINRPITR